MSKKIKFNPILTFLISLTVIGIIVIILIISIILFYKPLTIRSPYMGIELGRNSLKLIPEAFCSIEMNDMSGVVFESELIDDQITYNYDETTKEVITRASKKQLLRYGKYPVTIISGSQKDTTLVSVIDTTAPVFVNVNSSTVIKVQKVEDLKGYFIIDDYSEDLEIQAHYDDKTKICKATVVDEGKNNTEVYVKYEIVKDVKEVTPLPEYEKDYTLTFKITSNLEEYENFRKQVKEEHETIINKEKELIKELTGKEAENLTIEEDNTKLNTPIINDTNKEEEKKEDPEKPEPEKQETNKPANANKHKDEPKQDNTSIKTPEPEKKVACLDPTPTDYFKTQDEAKSIPLAKGFVIDGYESKVVCGTTYYKARSKYVCDLEQGEFKTRKDAEGVSIYGGGPLYEVVEVNGVCNGLKYKRGLRIGLTNNDKIKWDNATRKGKRLIVEYNSNESDTDIFNKGSLYLVNLEKYLKENYHISNYSFNRLYCDGTSITAIFK